jgi:hypothetical protein
MHDLPAPSPARTASKLLAAPVGPGAAAPIFAQDWWLDAAAPGDWRRVEVYWDKELVGALPFLLKRRFGLRVIEMPPFTRSLGPVLNLPPAKPVRMLQNMHKVVAQLLARLPSHDRFEVCLEPNDADMAFAFALQNYGVGQSFTFRAFPLASDFSVLERMHKKTRNIVAKATREFQVFHSTDFDRFIRMHRLERQSESRLDEAAAARLFAAARAYDSATLLIATDANGRDAAACALIWDRSTLYYWLSARDPTNAGASANSLLIVKAIELAGALGAVFDMDGFGSLNSGLFLSRFGLVPVVRPYINKSGRLWKALHTLSILADPRRFDRCYRF